MEIGEITIQKFSELNPEDIVAFNKEVYTTKKAKSIDEISWRFRIGFDKEIEPLYILQGGVILGQAGLSPMRYLLSNEQHTATWFNSFIISPSMQGKGLGKILTEKWMSLAPVHITNCNDNSMAVFRKLGWGEEFNTVRFALPINLYSTAKNKKWTGVKLLAAKILDPLYSMRNRLKYSKTEAIEISPLHQFSPEKLMDYFSKDSENSLLKDKAWFQWRFFSCPFSKEYSLARFKDASCIIRVLNFNGVRRLHLVYQTPESENNEELIKALVKFAFKNKVDFVWAITNIPTLKKSYEGFLTSQLKTRFAFHAEDEKIMKIMETHSIPLQAADSDYDIMYY